MRPIDSRRLLPAKRKEILDLYDSKCVYCLDDADEVDHVLPWSYRHDDSKENLVAACWLCNRIASNKMFDSFADKTNHILDRRWEFFKKHIIAIWTEDEVSELSRSLQILIRTSSIVAQDEDDRQTCAKRIMQMGFPVITGKTGKRAIPKE